MSEQSRIDSALAKHKAWYYTNWPLCVFCNHKVKGGDLAHIIPRSYASKRYTKYEQDTMLLNTGLAHRSCHTIWDDLKDQSVYLPRFNELMYITWLIDPDYFSIITQKLGDSITSQLPDFSQINVRELKHHGQLLLLL